MTDAKTQERPDGDAFADLRQLAQLRGEGPVVSPNALSPPGASRGEPIGTVEASSGQVIASRVDQTSAVLKPGDPIYEGDIVATRDGSGVQIDFADGTIGHLGPGARMLVQDVGTGTGSTAPVMFMINGPFSFASPPGGSAGANALTVRTPVASVRLEGGRLIGKAAPEAVENKFTLMRNFDGTLGRAVVATASASFVLDGELASAQVVSLFRAPSELPTPTLAQAQESVGGSVFDWLGTAEAGVGGGGIDAGLESIGPISVVLRGGPQLSFPEEQEDADRLTESSPNQAEAQEGSVTPPLSAQNIEPAVSTPDAPINISVESPFGGNQAFFGSAGFDTFTAQADPAGANAVTISQTPDGKVFLDDGAGNTISLDGFEELDINLGSSNDNITVGDLSNTDIADSTVRIDLGGGNDTADATAANRRHVIDGGDGDDTITGSSRGDDLNGDAGNDTLNGLAGEDNINGGAGNDIINGGADGDTITGGIGNDIIDGGTGNDEMSGGAGDDSYTVDSALDTVTELAGEGTDTISTALGFTLPDNVENLILTGASNIGGVGNALNNTLTGNSASNTLDGGAGADILQGGAGNDVYIIDNVGDTIVETTGTDFVQSSVTFTLAANVENLTLTGTGNINGTGNATGNTLVGNSGNNRLDGLGGADSMTGGAGDDTFVVNHAGDTVSETTAAGTDAGGTDTVESSLTFTLGANLENLTLTAGNNINGTGNTLANTLIGNGGNNTLDGGAGADTMNGGAGNDIYIVDNAGDIVADMAGGVDLVQSSVSFTLALGLENLTLTGGGPADGTGNAAANTITGNSANNILSGLGGNDTYFVQNTGDSVIEGAGGGIDTVHSSVNFTISDDDVENLTLSGSSSINATGNASNNILTGNTGNNILTGHAGNDTYFVQNAGDSVVEAVGEGSDTVNSSVSFTLSDHVENLILTGANLTGTGNALANEITGGDGNDTLIGLGGGDTLNGGGGTGDTASYAASGAGVVVVLSGAAGVGGDADGDILTNIENLVGSAHIDTLTGDGGANRIDGGAGADVMIGLGGNDTYIVDEATDTVTEAGGGGTDTVQSSANYVLSANVENLILTGAAITGVGNAENNVITGNANVNNLSGLAGNDTYFVQNSADTVVEAAGGGIDTVNSSVTYTISDVDVENLTLTGSGNINGTGNASGNTLTGNSGINILAGGGGDDIYVVQNTGDSVLENATEGTDTVQSSVTFTISDADVEHLTLTGSANINATGNASDNMLTGNSGDNMLIGLGGADAIDGAGGTGDTASYAASGAGVNIGLSGAAGVGGDAQDDTLTNIENLIGSAHIDALTGDGNANRIDGGAAADNMAGLGGDDTYVVDNIGDVVTEAAGGGTDTVESSVAFTLGTDLEHLTLTGAASVNGTGNALGNTITGNGAANALIGLGGVDTLTGGGGNDILFGGTGADTLNADSGADDLYFSNTGEGGDTVNNFDTGTDEFIFLQSAFGGGSLATGTLDATNFEVITEAYDGTNAASLGNTAGFVYDSTNGVLSYDSNGSDAGGGFTIATLSSGSVAASDIEITAASPV